MVIEKNINPYLIHKDKTLSDALNILNLKKLRFLICVEKSNKILGVLTMGDINRWLISSEKQKLNTQVFNSCNKKPVTALNGSPNIEIKKILNYVNFVPIVDKRGIIQAVAKKTKKSNSLSIGNVNVGTNN